MAVKQTIGARLRELREAKGLSMRAAAEACGTGHGYLSQIETDKRCPSADTVRRILDAYRLKWASLD